MQQRIAANADGQDLASAAASFHTGRTPITGGSHMTEPCRHGAPRRITRFAAAAFVLIAATSLGLRDAAAEVKAASSSRSLSQVPLLLADMRGYFKEAGADVNWKYIENQPAVMAALVSGEVDVASIGCQGVFDANVAGQDIQVITGISAANSLLVLSSKVASTLKVKADAPLNDRLRALKGMKIATSPVGTTNFAYLNYYLREAGLDSQKDVTILPAPDPGSIVAGVRGGRFDAGAYSVGGLEPLLADGSGVLWVSIARGDVPSLAGVLITCIAARSSYVKANPGVVKAIQVAMAKAANIARGPSSTTEIAAEVKQKWFAGMDPKLYQLSYASAMPGWYAEARIPKKSYDRLIEIHGAITRKDYSSVTFAKTVLPDGQGR